MQATGLQKTMQEPDRKYTSERISKKTNCSILLYSTTTRNLNLQKKTNQYNIEDHEIQSLQANR